MVWDDKWTTEKTWNFWSIKIEINDIKINEASIEVILRAIDKQNSKIMYTLYIRDAEGY